MNIKRRIEELERRSFLEPLIVRFIDRDGKERTGNVDDLEKCGVDFVRVVSGTSLEDVDRVLNFIAPNGSVIE